MGVRDPDVPKQASEKPGNKKTPRSAGCVVMTGGEARRGTAALADEELCFHTGRTGRGGKDFSLRVRYDDIKTLVADAAKGTLTVGTDDAGLLVFQIGRLAAAWKELIDERPSTARLFGVNRGARVAAIAVDDEELAAILPAVDAPGELDVAFVGVAHARDLARLGELAPRLREGGTVWAVMPKPVGAARLVTELAAAARGAGLVVGATIELTTGNEAVALVRRALKVR